MATHIFFDLDETLVCSIPYNETDSIANRDLFESFIVYTDLEETIPEFRVFVRPYLQELLNYLKAGNIKINVWSAGEKQYVLTIVDNLIKDKSNLELILWREHCNICDDQVNSKKSFKWLKEKIPRLAGDDNVLFLIDDLEENTSPNGIFGFNIKPFNVTNPEAINDQELKNLKISIQTLDSQYNQKSFLDRYWSF